MTRVLAFLILNLVASTVLAASPEESLTVTRSADAPDVVLIPGLSGCAFGFRQILPPLEEAGVSWAIVEPLAIGGSPRPEHADYSLTAQADRVAAVLDRIADRPVVVLAHGVSGSIAMRLALRRPDLVRAVISIEGGPHENAATPTVESSLKWASLAAKMGGGRLLRDRFKSDMEDASGDQSWITGYVVRKYFSHANRDLSAAITALRAMARAEEPQSLRDNLGRISCPVLLLKGGARHAGSVTPGEEEILSAGLSKFTTRTVAGAGHFIFEEQPDLVATVLIDQIVTQMTVTTRTGRQSCAQ